MLDALDEYDVDFDGIPVHCWEGGTGQAIVLLHGSGAGAATLSNFRRVLGPLAKEFRVLAADLVGFGQSGLRSSTPYFDMSMWTRQLRMLIDRTGQDRVLVVGHSLSGPIALKAAVVDDRIAGVVTTGTMGVPPAPGGSGPRWRFPESRNEVRQAIERTFFDKSLAEDDEVDRRMAVLSRPGYREYFDAMFRGPAADYISESVITADELAAIRCPVTLMHGWNDASFSPEESSLTLAKSIALADVIVLAECAHSVAHERPREFMAAVRVLVERIAEDASST